jgi:hypothetical protein
VDRGHSLARDRPVLAAVVWGAGCPLRAWSPHWTGARAQPEGAGRSGEVAAAWASGRGGSPSWSWLVQWPLFMTKPRESSKRFCKNVCAQAPRVEEIVQEKQEVTSGKTPQSS